MPVATSPRKPDRSRGGLASSPPGRLVDRARNRRDGLWVTAQQLCAGYGYTWTHGDRPENLPVECHRNSRSDRSWPASTTYSGEAVTRAVR